MKLKNMSKEELELLSYTDLADLILKENKKPLNTPIIFRTICELLGYSDSEYTNKIGEFYTSLTTDKRFILLETAEWDLKDNHSVALVIDDEDDIDDDMEDIEEIEEIEEEPDEEEIDDIVIDDDLDEDEDMEDLSIIEEDTEEEN